MITCPNCGSQVPHICRDGRNYLIWPTTTRIPRGGLNRAKDWVAGEIARLNAREVTD